MINYLNLYKDKKDFNLPKYKFIEENIYIDYLDYYQSNAVARASKTMNQCKNLKTDIKKTGTNG